MCWLAFVHVGLLACWWVLVISGLGLMFCVFIGWYLGCFDRSFLICLTELVCGYKCGLFCCLCC